MLPHLRPPLPRARNRRGCLPLWGGGHFAGRGGRGFALCGFGFEGEHFGDYAPVGGRGEGGFATGQVERVGTTLFGQKNKE